MLGAHWTGRDNPPFETELFETVPCQAVEMGFGRVSKRGGPLKLGMGDGGWLPLAGKPFGVFFLMGETCETDSQSSVCT